MRLKQLFLACLVMAFAATPALADAPNLLNYQGRLTDPSGNPSNGTFSMTFAIYDAESGGNQLPAGAPWTETQNVPVSNGVFNVLLGSVTPLPANLFGSNSADSKGPLRFLDVRVDDGNHNESLSPRSRIASAAYAVQNDISAHLYRSTSMDIPSITATAVSWDSEAWDTANLHDPSDPTRLTIPPGEGGKYLIYGTAVWNNFNGGIRSLYIRVGGLGGRILTAQTIPGSAAQNGWESVSTVYHLDPGDSVVFTVFQDSGATLGLSGGQNVGPGSNGGSSGASEFGIIKLQ